MKKNKKKVFPKLKKSVSDFLTDESGKITKKDALGLAAGSVLVAGVESVSAGHHSNWNPALPNYNGGKLVQITGATCSHVSGIVNGHISQTPGVNTNQTIHSHSSGHSNHGSGGWC